MKYFIPLLFALQSMIVFGQEKHKLKVEAQGFRNQEGQAIFILFDNDNGFPHKDSALIYVTAKIIEKKAEYTFTDLSSGKYSVLVYHDENKSLTLDKYFFGMPKEGIGATQNPSHIPSFENTSFMLDKSLLAKVLMTYL